MFEPLKLTMGDTWAWTRPGGDYLPSAGWVLTYYLAMPLGTVKTIVATGTGAEFSADVTAANTADPAKWSPGLYSWTARVALAGEVHVVGIGKMRIAPNPTTYVAPATHAETCLTIIEAALVKCLGDANVEFELDGLRVKKNRTELLMLRNSYREEVRRERGQLGMRVIPVSLR